MRFLVVDKMHDSLLPLLAEIGIDADYCPNISKSEIAIELPNYHGLIVRSKVFVDEQLLEKCYELKYICRAGAGIDNLDVDYIKSRGIEIINAPEGNRNAVAEHCLGLVFSLLNNIVKSHNEVGNYTWDREGNRGHEIVGKTFGIIGYGFMGSAVASKFQHLDCKIIVYDKYLKGFGTDLIKEVSLEQLFDETDILSIHVPLTPETKFMVDEEFLLKFKKKIWLINTSRGEILSLNGLVTQLETGKVRGAALDVLENEKINTFIGSHKEKFDKLVKMSNVITTPHVAGWTFESYKKINTVLVEKLKKII